MRAIAQREPSTSRWATRAALFSFGLVAAAAFLHRVFDMPTPVAFNLFVVALGVAVLSIACAAAASVTIWQSGRPGLARVLFAVCMSLALLALPLVYLMWVHSYPVISDITTDFDNPPAFVAAAKLRGPGANPVAYDRAHAADEQARAYPDIRPMRVARESDEVYPHVVDALKRLKMEIARDDPPDAEAGTPGIVEAVDRTLIMGLYEDVAIRVSREGEGARVDIRSAARFGAGDMGRNAERVREIVKEIQARLDASTPALDEVRPVAAKRTKPEKAGDPRPGSRRKSRDRGQ